MTQTQDGLSWLSELSDNWGQAMTAWQSLARAVPGVEDAMSRIAEPGQAFAQFMAALGHGLSEESLSAADISQRWRAALGANPAQMFAGQLSNPMRMPDFSQIGAPMLDMIRQQAVTALRTPAFGPAREQQERWQALLAAHLENQQAQARYQALLGKVMEQAFAGFENKLAEHEAPGRQLGSVRAIYDLWIDAAEEAYAEVALSAEFGVAYGEMVNAQMRMRSAQQNELERVCRELGMPTRSEVTAAHRKVHALERSLRALRAELAGKASAAPAVDEAAVKPAATKAAGKASARAASKGAAAAAGGKPVGAKKAAPARARKAATKVAKPRVAQSAARRRKGA